MTPFLYLYALVAEEPAAALGEGIAGEPLRLVRHGRIAAIVGDIGELGERPRPEAEVLKRQDAVVRRLAEIFAALLPSRFGESFADESELAVRIGPRIEDLATSLALVHGCVQMTLRVFGEPLAIPEAGEEIAGGPGTRHLESRRRERERSRSLPEIDPLREILRPLLRAERMERHAVGRLLGTAYHLVPRGQTGAYLAALETGKARLGGRRVAASGPWPPYAFAPEAVP